MKPYFLHITLIISACFLLFGCTPKSKIYNISQEARDYLCYKQGSYWIYKNDSTNVLDSVYVTNYEEHTENYEADKKLQSISQIINIYLSNRDKKLKINEQIDPNGSLYGEDNYNFNQSFSDYLIDLYQGNIQWNFYSKIDFTVNAEIYNNVIYKSYKSNYANGTDSTFNGYSKECTDEYWLAKNNWIIKKILHYNNTTQSWSLVRSHIVQ